MLNKITAVTVLSCVVSALAFVKPASAKITVELEEPDWQFVMRQHHRDDHRGRISREEGEFIGRIQNGGIGRTRLAVCHASAP